MFSITGDHSQHPTYQIFESRYNKRPQLFGLLQSTKRHCRHYKETSYVLDSARKYLLKWRQHKPLSFSDYTRISKQRSFARLIPDGDSDIRIVADAEKSNQTNVLHEATDGQTYENSRATARKKCWHKRTKNCIHSQYFVITEVFYFLPFTFKLYPVNM